jgi:hypothetical protein
MMHFELEFTKIELKLFAAVERNAAALPIGR